MSTKKITKPSSEFVKDCKSIQTSFEDLKMKLNGIIDKWINNGIDANTLRQWIRSELENAGYSCSDVMEEDVLPPKIGDIVEDKIMEITKKQGIRKDN